MFSLTDVTKGLQNVNNSQDTSQDDIIELGLEVCNVDTPDNVKDNTFANEIIQISKEMDNTCKL